MARGNDYFPVCAVRPLGAAWLRRRNWRLWVGGKPMARAFSQAVVPLRQGPDVIAISEENLLGHAAEAVSPTPYSNLGWRLRGLRALTAEAKLTLFLSIRSFDRLIPSAYAEGLRHGPPRALFAVAKEAVLAQPPSWLHMSAHPPCRTGHEALRLALRRLRGPLARDHLGLLRLRPGSSSRVAAAPPRR